MSGRRRHLQVAALLGLAACGGRGETAPASEPLAFAALAAGHGYTCAVAMNGETWCWGENRLGQLGVGDTADRLVPTAVAVGFPARAVATGWSHACALGTDDQLACWGDEREGALGDTLGRRSGGARLRPDAGPMAAAHVALGRHLTCALDAEGRAFCWGNDHRGERGDGNGAEPSGPTPRAVATNERFTTLAAGWQHVCGLSDTGQAWCWGDGHGLGRGSLTDSDVPVLVDSARRFVALTAGESVSCAIDDDQAAWCWGVDYDGQLGEGLPPRPNRFAPTRVAGAHRFIAISAGRHRVCALDADGAAWCWGSNYHGALGDGSGISQPAPVAVAQTVPYTQISAGDGHVCALDGDGAAWCWGENVDAGGEGAIGDGTRRNRATPVRVAPPAAQP